MAWLFLLLAAGAALFTLPGGHRSAADRRLSQALCFAGLAGALFSWKLLPLGLIVLAVGVGLYFMGYVKARLLGDPDAELEEEPTWRSKAHASPDAMDRREALSVLGLESGATAEDIVAAHRRMIAAAHPDAGGSAYLAAKVNAARDTLLS